MLEYISKPAEIVAAAESYASQIPRGRCYLDYTVSKKDPDGSPPQRTISVMIGLGGQIASDIVWKQGITQTRGRKPVRGEKRPLKVPVDGFKLQNLGRGCPFDGVFFIITWGVFFRW